MVEIERKPGNECETMSIPEAGKLYYDLGRNASYEAANRGDIPYIQVGRLKRVPKIKMKRKMAGE